MILIGFGGDSQYKFMEDEAMSLVCSPKVVPDVTRVFMSI